MLAASAGAAVNLLQLGVVVVVLALAARLARHLGFSTIPLYLVAGVAVGAISRPSFSQEFIATSAEVGVLLLLFALGLEYSALELTAGLRAGLKGGVIDFALNFPPGFVAALLLGGGRSQPSSWAESPTPRHPASSRSSSSTWAACRSPRRGRSFRCSCSRTWRWRSTFRSSRSP
jgi:hypothetical protein